MRYAKSILVFGFLIPGAIIVALAGAASFGFLKFDAAYKERQEAWTAHNRRLANIKKISAELDPVRDKMALYTHILAGDIQDGVSRFLDSTLAGQDGEVVERTRLEFPSESDRGAGGREVRASFNARYEGMQRVIAAMEDRFPQLNLKSIRISRKEADDQIPTRYLVADIAFFTSSGNSTPTVIPGGAPKGGNVPAQSQR